MQGGWELDESVEEAACRESLEEAGVLGNVEVSTISLYNVGLALTHHSSASTEHSCLHKYWSNCDEIICTCRMN